MQKHRWSDRGGPLGRPDARRPEPGRRPPSAGVSLCLDGQSLRAKRKPLCPSALV